MDEQNRRQIRDVIQNVAGSWVPPEPTAAPTFDYPRCLHERTELRLRRRSNGATVVVKQCLHCGNECGSVPKSTVTVAAVRDWDDELPKRWERRMKEALEKWRRDQESVKQRDDEKWWQFYNAYLQSPQWRARAGKVMARCQKSGNLCEGCGLRPPVQVHHTSYEHVGSEFLWELRAVCLECHQRLHPQREILWDN